MSSPPIAISPRTYRLPLSNRFSPSEETTPRPFLKRKLAQSLSGDSPRIKERPFKQTSFDE